MSTPAKDVEEYDLVIIGSGEGGKYLAWTLARQGQRVIVLERKWIDGSCPNIACLPSKNIISTAKVASFFYRSEEFGISKENVRINMAAVRDRKRAMVTGLVDMHLDIYKRLQTTAESTWAIGDCAGSPTLPISRSMISVWCGTISPAAISSRPGVRCLFA